MFPNLEEYDSPIERIMFGNNNYGDVVGQGDIPISKDSSLTNVKVISLSQKIHHLLMFI
jgi:hypothetical protein